MKKTILIFITVVFLMAVLIPNFTYATLGLGNLEKYKGTNADSEELKDKVGKILGIIRAIGTVFSVAILAGIGIKYLFASVEEKADYKQTLIPYIIGAAILFTGTTIPQLIYSFVNEI